MKALGLWLALLAATLSPAVAQVGVELVQEQDQFLPSESMPVAVRITNRSGQTLRLGQTDDWLIFSVETADNQVVPKTGEMPVAGEFVLESSRVVTLRVDLAPCFLSEPPGAVFRHRHHAAQGLEPECPEPAQELRHHPGLKVVGAGDRRA